MKKKLIPVIVIMMLLAIVIPASAASPAPGGPFSTAFRVQNLDAGDVYCDYTFYDATGAVAKSSGQQGPIKSGDSLFVYVPQVSGLNSGSYSGVVGCTGKVAAVANFADADSAASFNGISSAATSWSAPAVYNNYYGYYSSIVAQNATSGPVDITLNIYQPGNPSPVYTKTASAVPGYASVSFEQEGLTELKTNQFYSAKITATGNVAPVVTIYGKGAVNNQLYAYNPFQTGSKTFYAPVLLKNYYGNNSALVIQNMSTDPSPSGTTHVVVTYSNGSKQEKDVTAGAAWSIYIPSEAPTSLPSGNIGIFSATITSSTQDIAVIVNESNNYNRAASIDGFSSGSNVVMVPALEKRYVNFNSSVTCQNLSATPSTLTIKYFDASGNVIDSATSPVLNQGQNTLFYQPSSKLPNNWLGSGRIQADAAGALIACVVNQDMNEGTYATTSMDQLQAYEGVAP